MMCPFCPPRTIVLSPPFSFLRLAHWELVYHLVLVGDVYLTDSTAADSVASWGRARVESRGFVALGCDDLVEQLLIAVQDVVCTDVQH